MRIAILGTRGIPARYGGFETCAEELAIRLAQKGHEVWVYCRSHLYEEKLREYRQVKLVYLPALRVRFLETLSHTIISILYSLTRRFDIHLVFNYGNSPLLPLFILGRKKVILHTDGLEWKRSKWSKLGRAYYRLAEWVGARLPLPLISDSREIERYYFKKYRRVSYWIPYGASPVRSEEPALLQKLGIKPLQYFLQVTRFEPENNPLLTLEAFSELKTAMKLVLVGGVTYPSPYSSRILEVKDPRVILPGFVYDKRLLQELLTNCYTYVHGNEVGGTNPALLEAMGAGCFVIARDVPFNREVLAEAGLYFQKDKEDLKRKMTWALEHSEEVRRRGEAARKLVEENYSWEMVVDKYEALFQAVASGQIKK